MKKLVIYIICISFLIFSSCNIAEQIKMNTTAYPLDIEHSESNYANNVLSYKNSNQTVLRIYSAPIENSKNTITKAKDEYVANGEFTHKKMPNVWSNNTPIAITHDSNFVEIIPIDLIKYESELTSTTNIFEQERNTVIYKNVFGNGINLTFSPTTFGVNMEIVFSEPPEQNTYRFKLKLPELIPNTNSLDYISFKTTSKEENVKTVIETPLLSDKTGKWSYDNFVQLIEKDSGTGIYAIEYSIDEDFINQDSTQYPIKVNHSINLYMQTQPDTSIYENTKNEAEHYLSPYMLLGNNTIKGEGWAFIRYETLEQLDIPIDKIVSAKYVFRNLFNLPKKIKLGAYAVTDEWCSINQRWFNRPTYDNIPVSQTDVHKSGDYSLDVTPLLYEILKNKGIDNSKYSIENSFFIKSDTLDSNLIIPSGDGGLFSPYLEIILKE